MDVIRYFKAFNIGSLFQKSTRHLLGVPQKNLDISSEYSEDYSVANITGAKTNNGVSGYLKDDGIVSTKKNINHMTIVCDGDGGTGAVFFQDRYFTSTATANIIDILDINLKNILDSNHISYLYISNLLTKIFLKSGTYSRDYKIDNSNFNREIILLPVISCEETESIWEDIDEDGNITYLTLDVEYIKELMDTAKKRKEEKTIRFYEAQAAKYELEKAKYELEKAKYESNPDFVRKLKESHFKAFKLGDLFDTRAMNTDKPIKNREFSKTKDDVYEVALVSSSKENNGVIGYITDEDAKEEIVFKNALTMAVNGSCGVTFFHDYDFCTASTDAKLLLLLHDKNLEKLCLDNVDSFKYFAQLIQHSFYKSGIYNWGYKPSQERFNREIILLPVISCEETGVDDIQPDIMSYYYILGQERLYQNKINYYNDYIL